MVSWGWSISWSWSLWVDSGSLVGDISDISIITIGRVLDVLDSAIRKSNGVRSGNVGSTIGLFLSVEARLGVVISNSVGVGVGGDLIRVSLNWGMVNWGMVSWGSVDYWGSMDSVGNNWGSVDSVGNWVGNNWSSVDSVVDWGMDGMGKNWSSMSNTVWGNRVEWDNSVLTNWNWPVGSNGGLDLGESLGVVSLVGDTVGGSESLALAQGSDLTVGGGDRLVRGLSSNNSVVDWGMDSVDSVDWGMSNQDLGSWGGCGISQQGHADESLKL